MLRRTQLFLSINLEKNSKVYEMRMYDIIPSKYDTFHRLCTELLPQRSMVSKCQGYWVVQAGQLNQMIHLWEYDSMQHRYSVRKAVEADEDWRRKFSIPQSECLSAQKNYLLRMISRESAPSTKSYKYRLTISTEKTPQLNENATLAASFLCTVGEVEGQYLHLVKGKDLDAVMPDGPLQGNKSKILGPARWAAPIGCLWR